MNRIAISPLSTEELYDVTGGDDAWYYLFYAMGWFAHAYTDNYAEMTSAIGNGRR